MRRVRVIVRGAGLSASGLTNANGVARIGVKPEARHRARLGRQPASLRRAARRPDRCLPSAGQRLARSPSRSSRSWLRRQGAGSTAPVELPAAGQLAWPRVAVQAKPDSSSRRIAVLGEFLPDFRRRVVLALDVVTDNAGSAAWYRISLPGRPNGRSGWVAARVALADADAPRDHRPAQCAHPLELHDRGRLVLRTRRGRRAEDGDAARNVLRHGLIRADRSVPRRLRVLHDRLRAAEQLARRRRRRHPTGRACPWLLGAPSRTGASASRTARCSSSSGTSGSARPSASSADRYRAPRRTLRAPRARECVPLTRRPQLGGAERITRRRSVHDAAVRPRRSRPRRPG